MRKSTFAPFLCFCFGLLSVAPALGQSLDRSVLSSSGSTYSASSMELDFSLGEVAINTVAAGSFLLTEGFHQPSGSEASNILPLTTAFLEYKLYPVPAESKITLELAPSSPATVYLTINSIDGKILHGEEVIIHGVYKQEFSVRNFASGAYFINVHRVDGTLLKSLRFIKQ